MTTFPGSPRLLKGAIIGFDLMNPLASVIVFQYNPEKMTRKVDARTKKSSGPTGPINRSEALVLTGPPLETITISVEIDASDQLEAANPLAEYLGIYPTLSALEMLLYPKSLKVIQAEIQAKAGSMPVIASEAPMTLFIWGPQRVLPVRLTSFSISEEAYDPLLNPTRAKVDLSLQVLTYSDLNSSNPGHYIFLAHQIAKELMATSNAYNSIRSVGASLKLF